MERHPKSPHEVVHRTWRIALFLCGVLLAQSCASAVEDGDSRYVEIPGPEFHDGDSAAGASMVVSPRDARLAADYAVVLASIEGFLERRRDIILGDLPPEAAGDFMADSAVATVVAERNLNDQQLRGGVGSAIERLGLWPNIVSIDAVADRLRVVDCTEWQQVNSFGHFDLWFVKHELLLEWNEPNWRVVAMDKLHNGIFDPGERLGCVPQSFAIRAEAVAAQAWEYLVEVARDPLSNVDHDPPAFFGADLSTYIASSLKSAEDEAPLPAVEQQAHFTALGIDTASDLFGTENGTTVVVESCRTFPGGSTVAGPQADERQEHLPPNAEQAQLIYVVLDAGPESAYGAAQVVGIETKPNWTCGGQQ